MEKLWKTRESAAGAGAKVSSKRRAPEAEVVRFFMSADLQLATTVYRMVKGILDQRGAFAAGKPAHRPRPLTRQRAVGSRDPVEPPADVGSDGE